MYSNMKYYENICNCLRVIQQDINRKLKSANCWQQTSLILKFQVNFWSWAGWLESPKTDFLVVNCLFFFFSLLECRVTGLAKQLVTRPRTTRLRMPTIRPCRSLVQPRSGKGLALERVKMTKDMLEKTDK